MFRAQRLLRTTAGTAGATIWLAALGLVTTPFLIHLLGVPAYGVFALVTMVSAYLSNLEFGFGHATLRFLTQAHAAGDFDAQRAILATSFAVFLCAGLIAFSIAVAISGMIINNFATVPEHLAPQALDAMRLAAGILLVSFLTSLSSAVLRALGDFSAVIVGRLAFGTLASGAAVVAAATTGEVQVVVLSQLVTAILLCMFLAVRVRRVVGGWIAPWVHGPTLRSMASFGLFVLVSGIAYQVMLQGPVTVLAGTSDLTAVASFAVPYLVFVQLAALVTAPSMGFLPFASGAVDQASRAHLSAVFTAYIRLTIIVMGPITIYLCWFAAPLLAAWIDPAFASTAASPMRLLSAAALLLAMSGAPADVARGLGRPAWVLLYTGTVAALTLTAALLLVQSDGASGAAVALLFGLSVCTVPFLVLVAVRLLDIRLRTFLRALRRPMIGVGLVGLVYAAAFLSSPTLAGAVIGGALGTSVYAALVPRLVLDPRERRVVGLRDAA